jgi:hypothetical protein
VSAPRLRAGGGTTPRDDLAIGVPGENAGAGVVNVLDGSEVGLVGASLFTQDAAGVGGAAESGDAFGAAVD